MKLGVNWSGVRELNCLERFLLSDEIDFVEILIDNFLNVNPLEIRDFLDGTEVSFHIMNSQFLADDSLRLDYISDQLKSFSDILSPLYVSDHLGIFFTGNNLPLPQMAEVNYNNISEYCEKILSWRSKLGMDLLLENYPSAYKQEVSQLQCIKEIINLQGIDLLFDISNAVIAEINDVELFDNWKSLYSNAKNFHLSGFRFSSFNPTTAIDTHDNSIDSISFDALSKTVKCSDIHSLVIERDDNFNFKEWSKDLTTAKSFF